MLYDHFWANAAGFKFLQQYHCGSFHRAKSKFSFDRISKVFTSIPMYFRLPNRLPSSNLQKVQYWRIYGGLKFIERLFYFFWRRKNRKNFFIVFRRFLYQILCIFAFRIDCRRQIYEKSNIEGFMGVINVKILKIFFQKNLLSSDPWDRAECNGGKIFALRPFLSKRRRIYVFGATLQLVISMCQNQNFLFYVERKFLYQFLCIFAFRIDCRRQICKKSNIEGFMGVWSL